MYRTFPNELASRLIRGRVTQRRMWWLALTALGCAMVFAARTGFALPSPHLLVAAVVVMLGCFAGRVNGLLAGLCAAGFFVYLHFSALVPALGGIAELFVVSVLVTACGFAVGLLRDRYDAFTKRSRDRERRIMKNGEWARITLSSIGEGVIRTDAQGRIDFVNPSAQRLTGWDESELLGRSIEECFTVVDENTLNALPNPVSECIKGRKSSSHTPATLLSRQGGEVNIQHSAAPILGSDGGLLGVVLVFSDVSESGRLSQKLAYQASHDALTGLLNRTAFEEQLNRAITSAKQSDATHALMYADLDHFKVVNDTCGHVAGDELLKQLASLLREDIRRHDSLARLGGDEFGLLLERCSLNHATHIAEKIVEAFEGYRFAWNDQIFEVGISIGIIEINRASADAVSLLGAADRACYAAKDAGRNRVHVYQEDDSLLTQRKSAVIWLHRVQQSIEQERLVLYGQAIAPARASEKEQIYGIEILLRMKGAGGDVILPGAFLPAMQRFNFSGRLDRWVVAQALMLMTEGSGIDGDISVVSLNISGQSIGDRSFKDHVLEVLERSKVPGDKICFEITETVAISNLVAAQTFIASLKERGCRFALDDFGSGFSSFAHLKGLDVDYVKIDGSLVKGMVKGDVDQAMVRSITEIGQLMDKQVIAEWVEDETTRDQLCSLGVDFVQGFAVSRPVPIANFQNVLH